MRVKKDFAPTTPDEVRDCGFDYRNDLSEAEKLVSAAFEIEVHAVAAGATQDAAPNSRKVGAADIEDSEDDNEDVVAVQRLTGMIDGNTYNIICRATTDNGQVLELSAHMACRSAS